MKNHTTDTILGIFLIACIGFIGFLVDSTPSIADNVIIFILWMIWQTLSDKSKNKK